MRRFAFSRLLLFVVVVPLAGLAIFGGRLTYESWSRYSELSRAESVLRLAVAAARFGAIAVPGEGGATRELVGGEGNRAKLDAQRRITDDLYRDVRQAVDALTVKEPRLDEELAVLDAQLQKIIAFRAQVDAGSVKSPGASALVVAPAAALAIDVVATASAVVSDAELSRRIFALYATIEFAENATLQRGRGEAALKDGRLSSEAFAIFVRAVSLHATFAKLFNEYVPPQIVAQFKAFDTANGRELEDLRKFILANAAQPAAATQQRRWTEIYRDLAALMANILSSTADSVSADGEQMLSSARRDLFVYLAIFIAVLGGVIVLSRTVMRALRELLGELADALGMMRDGHFEVAIPHVKRGDEIGMMARAVEGFRKNFVIFTRVEHERSNAEVAAERKALMEKLASDFDAVVGAIVDAVSSASGELTATATTLTKTAESAQQLSATVAAASEEASTNVQSVASATEELVASVTEIGRQVQESSRISDEAVDQARKTDERIAKLAEAASRIGDVTQLITSIAEQTNLLALNATIEAARAGEAGKGFAVVASEVKQLASQTAKATSEISTQIAEMQAATQDSVAAITEIGGTIRRISEIATTIASAVEQQGAATQEITRNIQHAAAGTTQVASNITDVSSAAGKTGTASADVLSAAKSLADQSDRLKIEVDEFLRNVRAA